MLGALCCFVAVWSSVSQVPPASISLEVENESLSDLCRALSQQTGQDFQVRQPLADRKVTVFCSKRPLSEFIAAASDVLSVTFVQRGRHIDIERSQLQADSERGQHHSDIEGSVRRITDALEVWSDCATLLDDGYSQLKLGLLPRESDLEKGHLSITPASIKALAKSKLFFRVAAACRGKFGEVAARLCNGDHLDFSTRQSDGLTFVDGALRGGPDVVQKDHSIADLQYSLFYDAPSGLLYLINTGEHPSGIMIPTVATFAVRDLVVDSSVRPGPLEAQGETFAAKLPSTLADLQLGEIQPARSGGLDGMVCLSAHCKVLFKATDVPIIADGSRIAATAPWPDTPATFGEYWSRLLKSELEGSRRVLGMKIVNGWLCLHHDKWWEVAESEIPERLLMPMEEAYRSGKGPTLDQYGAFANQVSTPPSPFVWTRYVVDFPIRTAAERWSHFRLYGSLSPAQHAAALNGGLRLSDLSADQRTVARRAIEDICFTPAMHGSWFAEALGNKSDYQPWLFEVSVREALPGSLVQDLEVARGALTTHNLKPAWNVMFSYGLGGDNGLRSSIELGLRSEGADNRSATTR